MTFNHFLYIYIIVIAGIHRAVTLKLKKIFRKCENWWIILFQKTAVEWAASKWIYYYKFVNREKQLDFFVRCKIQTYQTESSFSVLAYTPRFQYTNYGNRFKTSWRQEICAHWEGLFYISFSAVFNASFHPFKVFSIFFV